MEFKKTMDGHGWTRMKMDFRSFTHWVKQSKSSNVFIIRDNLRKSVVELRFQGSKNVASGLAYWYLYVVII